MTALWNDVKTFVCRRNKTFVGEIETLIEFENVDELDMIGKAHIVVPLNHTPTRQLLKKNRIIVITATAPSTAKMVLTQFVIEKIDDSPRHGTGTTTVSGSGLSVEFTYETLGYNVISDGNDGPSDNPFRELIDLYEANSVINWSISNYGHNSKNRAYLVGSGEPIWDAMLQVAQANNLHIISANRYQDPDGNGQLPYYNLSFWSTDHPWDGSFWAHWFSRLILENKPPTGYPDRRPIRGINKQETTAGTITRAYLCGAGLGEDRFIPSDATDDAPDGYTFYPSTGLLINNTLEADPEQPRITRVIQFGNIKPEDITSLKCRQTASNAVLASGVQALMENDGSTTTYYEVETTAVANHAPGQVVYLKYDHTSPIDADGAQNPTNIISVDDSFYLIKYTTKMGAEGNLIAKCLLGKKPRSRKTASMKVVKRVKDLETTVRHAKAGASTSSPGTGTPAGGNYLTTTNSPALAGDLQVNQGVRIDSTDISELKLSDFILMNPSAEAIRGRVLQAINGLQLVDNGAGSTATLSLLLATLSGLIISDNKVGLGTPSTITPTSENAVTAVSHSHEIESSSNPGQTEKVLSTDQTGRLQIYRLDTDKLVLVDRTTDEKFNLFIENGRLYIESI